MLRYAWGRSRYGTLAIAVVLAMTLASGGSLADTRRHDHDRHSGALMGGLFGAAILGTMIYSLTQPHEPPRYIYVEPPPAYYVPPPVPAYPPPGAYPPPAPDQPPAYAPAPIPPGPSLTERLEDLQLACRRGLLTKSECDAKRKAIIEGM